MVQADLSVTYGNPFFGKDGFDKRDWVAAMVERGVRYT